MAAPVGWRKSLCHVSEEQLKPDYTEALGLLSHLNSYELQEILSDDKKCEDIIKDLKLLKEIQANKEMLVASNRSLAEFNLAKEPQLTGGKQRIQELSEEGECIYKNVEAKFEEVMKHNKIHTTLTQLQTSAAEVEEESETVASKFLDGEIDVEEFLEKFVPRRKLMHLRKVKVDKLSEMVTKRKMFLFSSSNVHSSSAMPNCHFDGPGCDHHTPPRREVPYPTGTVIRPGPNAADLFG